MKTAVRKTKDSKQKNRKKREKGGKGGTGGRGGSNLLTFCDSEWERLVFVIMESTCIILIKQKC